MSDDPPSASVDRELATKIVAAYVRRNQIGSDQLPALIATVYQALGRLGKLLAEPARERTRSPRLCRVCGMRVAGENVASAHRWSRPQRRAISHSMEPAARPRLGRPSL